MKVSYDGKPKIFNESKSVTSLGINKLGNVYAYKTDNSSRSESREKVVKTLAKARF